MKNSLKTIISRLAHAEEPTKLKIGQIKLSIGGKELKKNEEKWRDLCDTIRWTNIFTMGIREAENKK